MEHLILAEGTGPVLLLSAAVFINLFIIISE